MTAPKDERLLSDSRWWIIRPFAGSGIVQPGSDRPCPEMGADSGL